MATSLSRYSTSVYGPLPTGLVSRSVLAMAAGLIIIPGRVASWLGSVASGVLSVKRHVRRVDGLDGVDAGEVGGDAGALDGLGPLDVGHDGVGVERRAVGERDVVAQRHART